MNYFLKKSQNSLEFLMIFVIGFIIIILFGAIFFNYSLESKSYLDKNQIDRIGNEIVTNIEKIYFLGNNNMITLNSNFPDGIENFTIVHINFTDRYVDYINISYYDEKNINHEIFQMSENYIRLNCTLCNHTTNINGNYTSYFNSSDFSEGAKRIRILSKGNFIEISFTKLT